MTVVIDGMLVTCSVEEFLRLRQELNVTNARVSMLPTTQEVRPPASSGWDNDDITMTSGIASGTGDKTSPSVPEDKFYPGDPLLGVPGVAVAIADDTCVSCTEHQPTSDSTTIFPRTKARKRLD